MATAQLQDTPGYAEFEADVDKFMATRAELGKMAAAMKVTRKTHAEIGARVLQYITTHKIRRVRVGQDMRLVPHTEPKLSALGKRAYEEAIKTSLGDSSWEKVEEAVKKARVSTDTVSLQVMEIKETEIKAKMLRED